MNLGPLRHWALSPDALLEILRDISARNGPRVIEFGAGESTLAIAAPLCRMGGGSPLTVEHNPDFAAAVQRRVERQGLADRTRAVIPPMRNYPPWHGLPAFRSYDLGGLDEQFEVALVDGTIVAEFGNATRAVPLIWCLERPQNGASIFLDDANRPPERAIAKALRLDWTALEIEHCQPRKAC
ncbi:MAG: class I SAM-dependent methyltransferase [Terriglobales bacterium]